MASINTSNSTFSNFRKGGFLYVDKTRYLYDLIKPFQGQYFLARPRRFGKSLMISTLRSIFEGQRQLFEGLEISKLEHDWKTHPVIHLNMGSVVGDTKRDVEESLQYVLSVSAKENGVELKGKNACLQFDGYIRALSARGPVVVLVDEYDKPLLGHLGETSALEVQSLLKNFYGVIKTTEELQRFAMITGVSQFSKVSIFSDLNNLTDLSMHAPWATALGYTQSELEANFSSYIEALSDQQKTTRQLMLEQLKEWYNGYRFHDQAESVYNPVSVMKCFAELEFKNFWFETGTPRFLVDLLKEKPLELTEDLSVPASAFVAYEPDRLQVLPLLVQTGYLTIKSSDTFGGEKAYRLGYPNREVDQSFNRMLTMGLSMMDDVDLNQSLRALLEALHDGRIEDLLTHLKVFFAGIPYDIQLSNEKYYQSLFFVIFRMLGTMVEAETRSASGRIDALLKTPDRIVLFEFKFMGSAREAMDQMDRKEYALAYEDDGRELIRVGVAFDATTRNIGEFIIA